MTQMSDIVRFRMERDRALLTGDIREVRKFAERWHRNVPPMKSIRSEMAAMHKATVTARTLPPAYRARSRAWLLSNGFDVPK